MKILDLLKYILLLNMISTQLYERNYLEIEDMREAVLNDIDSMQSHHSQFRSLNLFYLSCPEKIVPMLQTLSILENQAELFCKLIENTMPTFFLPIFMIDVSKNEDIIINMIKKFFNAYTLMSFKLDNIKIAKLYEKNISVLFSLRNIYLIDFDFYENIFLEFLPNDSSLVSKDLFTDANDKFLNLIIFKFLEKTKEFLVKDNKLFLFTIYEMFEQPYEVIQLFLNDISYINQIFRLNYRERRLYLLDNLDNLALKSLSIFKADKTHDMLKKLAKQADESIKESPEDSDLNQGEIEDYKDLQKFLHSDPYAPEEKVKADMNYRLINNCVKNSGFSSQSLEKMYCYFVTLDIPDAEFIIKNEFYNDKLARIFRENSELHMKDFVTLKPSYFTEESQYDEEIYPKFKLAMNHAAIKFKRDYNALIEKFYDDHFYGLKKNFMYYWRSIINNFLSSSVFEQGIQPESLYTNIINYFEFVDKNWNEKLHNDFFQLNEFTEKFITKYHDNINKFTKFK